MRVKASFGNKKYQIYLDQEQRFLSHHLRNRPGSYYNRVRTGINSLRGKSTQKYDGLLLAFIEAVKQYQVAAGQVPPSGYTAKKHRLSDHAFCAALSRVYGLDVLGMKDEVLQRIEYSNLRYVEKDGVIVTVLAD